MREKPGDLSLKQGQRVCSCGKGFMVTYSEGYVYKILTPVGGHDWYCSYTCWNKALKKKEKRIRENRGRQKKVEA